MTNLVNSSALLALLAMAYFAGVISAIVIAACIEGLIAEPEEDQ